MKKNRVKIPQKIEDDVLHRSHHMCNICQIERKPVNIHHIDENPANNDPLNLIVLCKECHELVQSRGYGKGYTKGELYRYRSDWEAIVREKFRPRNLESQIYRQEKITDTHLQEYQLPKEKVEIKLITNKERLRPETKSTITKLANSLLKSRSALRKTANKFFDTGRYNEAIDVYDQLIKIDPSSRFAATGNKGLALIRLGKLKEGIKLIKKLHKQKPKNIINLINLTHANIQINKLPQAQKYIDKALTLTKKNPEVHIQKGIIYEKQGKFNDAILSFNKALKIKPNDSHSLYHRGLVYRKMMRLKKSFSDIKKSYSNTSKNDSQKPYTLHQLGALYCISGNHQKALNIFNKLDKSHPKSEIFLGSKGQELSHLKRDKEASKCLDKLLILFPTSIRAHMAASRFYSDINNSKTSFSIAESGLKFDPKNIHLLFTKGLALGQLDKHNKAIQIYHKILKIKPDLAAVMINLGNQYFNLGKNTQANYYFDRALKIEPENIVGLSNKAECLLSLGDIKNAKRYLKKSLKIDSNFHFSIYNQSKILIHEKKTSEGLKLLQKAIKLNGDYKNNAKKEKVFNNIKNDSRFLKIIK